MKYNIMEDYLTGIIGAISGIIGWIKVSLFGTVLSVDVGQFMPLAKVFEVIISAAIGTIIALTIKELWTYYKRKIKKKEDK